MSTTTRPARFVRGIPTTALVIIGAIALALAGLTWGFRELDHSRSSEQSVVVAEVNGTSCTVQSLTDDTLVMTVPCEVGVWVGWTTTIPVGGLTHQPLGTGLDTGLGWLWWVLFMVGLLCSYSVFRRRSAAQRHALAAAAPASLPSFVADDDDRPVSRDRWALATPLPPGVPTAVGVTGERVVYVLIGAFLAMAAAVLLDPVVQRAGLAGPARVAVAALVAAAVLAVGVRLGLRSARWSREGITVRGYLSTGRYAWSDVDHVTAEATETRNKSGHFWTLVPTLVLTTGERVDLGVFAQTEGGMVQLARGWVGNRAMRRYDTLNAWLASANVPVDGAYEALRPWKQGRISVDQAVALSDSPPATLYRAPQPEAPEPIEVAATPTPTWAATSEPGPVRAAAGSPTLTPQRFRSSTGVRVLLVLGGLLLALPAFFLVVGTPLLIYELTNGQQVTAVVESRSGDRCVIVDSADASSTWATRCLGDWQPGDRVDVVISSEGKVMTWGNTVTGLAGWALFCLPGVTLLTIGLILRHRQRRRASARSADGPVPVVVSSG